MKKLFLLLILFCTSVYSQNIYNSSTTITSNAPINGMNLQGNPTITFAYGVSLTITGNIVGNGTIIFSGNNTITVNGNINIDNIVLYLQGNVCVWTSSNLNVNNSSSVIGTGTNNYLSGVGINGLSNITSNVCSSVQSANPCSNTDNLSCSNDCSSSTTWNGSSWNNGTPTSSKKAIISGNYSSTSFICCSLTINSGSTLTINSGIYITVLNNLRNNGTLNIEDSGNLVQVSDNSANSGNISLKRTTKPVRYFDYTYWSSPVSSQSFYNLTPLTNPSRYYSWNSVSQSWTSHYTGAVNMAAGVGYIAWAPSSYSATNPVTFTGVFQGSPNNGVIDIPVSGGNKWHLLGNPYPSAISADRFITENSGKFYGTVYFWTHNTPPSSAFPGEYAVNYTANDYASYNLTGGVATAAKANSTGVNQNVPNGLITSGQGFFVQSISNTTTGAFKNVMRSNSNVAYNNSQFFRTSQEKSRIWLNLIGEEVFSQTLVGYVEGATNGVDESYDGVKLDGGNPVGLYSLIGDLKVGIQGKSFFTQTDSVNLSIKISQAGSYKISLDDFDGIFLNQDIYLEDNGVLYNLKNSDYIFTSEAGTFDNRFILKYQNTTLGIHEIVKDSKFIKDLYIYDINGRCLKTIKNINSQSFVLPSFGTKLLIIKVVYEDESTNTVKIITK